MRRRTVVPLTLSVGGTLLLAGCYPADLPAWASDACNIFASWDDAARPEADRNRVAAALSSVVPPAEDSAIARCSRAFAAAMTAGDAADVEAASALFRDECVTGGWEPAEG